MKIKLTAVMTRRCIHWVGVLENLVGIPAKLNADSGKKPNCIRDEPEHRRRHLS